jgi:putative transposase
LASSTGQNVGGIAHGRQFRRHLLRRAGEAFEAASLEGKSAIHVARHGLKRERNDAGQQLWARGYSVDTVGRDPEKIRRSIQQQEQEEEDRRLDQLELSDPPQQQTVRKQN